MPGNFGTDNSQDGVFGSTTAPDHVGVFGFNEGTAPPTGGGAGGSGVFGLSVSPGAAGVFGSNNSAQGVGVQGNGPDAGISGFSDKGAGVRSHSNHANAVEGFAHDPNGNAMLALHLATTPATATDGSPHGNGILAVTTVPGAAGVFGSNNDPTRGVGVQGNGPERGISGFSAKGAGTVGQSTSGSGVLATSSTGQGLSAFSDNDVGVFAQGATFAGVFNGALVVSKGPNPNNGTPPSNINGSIVINDGNLFVNKGDISMGKGDIKLSGADCAEDFDVCGQETILPGTVMVINAQGALQPSEQAYDRKVAGVISGAGEYRPGLVLDNRPSDKSRMPIALIGKVFCRVDAQYAPITVGDLLTTSPTPGHAMKAGDPAKAFGSVIGKALRHLKDGQALIPILITLQ